MAPIYLFRSEAGELVEEMFHVEHAPKGGEWAKINGQKCQRIYSVPVIAPQKDVHFASQQLPRNHPAAPAVNEKGQPVFSSRSQVDEFCAKTQATDPHGGYEWGDM